MEYTSSNTIGWTNKTMILIGNYRRIHVDIQNPMHTYYFISENKLHETDNYSVNIFTGGPDYSRDNYSLEV